MKYTHDADPRNTGILYLAYVRIVCVGGGVYYPAPTSKLHHYHDSHVIIYT